MTSLVSNTRQSVESITTSSSGNTSFGVIRLTVAVLFLLIIGVLCLFTFGVTPLALYISCAAVAGGYMAINIGANDVANNVGPAVGSGALT